MMPRTHLPRDVIPAKADDRLALSPAPSGEREEAGPTCPAEGEGRPLVLSIPLLMAEQGLRC